MSTPNNPYENNGANNPGNNPGDNSVNNPSNGDANFDAAAQQGNPNYMAGQAPYQQGGFQQSQQQPPLGQRKLHRSVNDRMIAGVAGGIAETYNIDPTLVRVLFVAATLLGFSGLLIYIICWIIIPDLTY
ncbi:phage shock protein C (PspC) family protein [Corynebacterium appendicis CIP 107643]|uniref:Phage shock protein C (PspC) family protein n=1 Tax=Corynebacterium appendicis CIP 107643 TaxID=1161099 RepID=A0A1N7KDB9_9CORY|nr:PspC domain-containing protein [Corynebacterium appendicis]WJY60861.1 DNA-binding transcriptional activator PspC [Corynebacterium appendicis CIP 107643]SIS59549.1 phage shock protein C (PspC) family protein [Corynebacterium appendicis CIP 107643]